MVRRRSQSGLLVTLEGTEGSGKSTLIHGIAERLRSDLPGVAVTITREPGGSPVAERIREILLADFQPAMDPWTELFLYEAARAEHLARTVRPALAEGRLVLCDRFTDSSLAYQAHARGLPWEKVSQLNRLATQGLRPDLSLFLDIDPAEGLRRARQRTRFEAEGVEFQARVRRGFLKAIREDRARWVRLHSERSTASRNAELAARAIRLRWARTGGRR